MGRLGFAGVAILVTALLAPAAAGDSPLADCTVLRYSILPNLGGAIRVCPEDLDYEIGGLIPDVPGFPGGDDDAIDFVATPCEGDRNGVHLALNGKPSFACLSFEVVAPSEVPTPGVDGSVDFVPCTGNSQGLVLHAGATTAGLCAVVTFGNSPNGDTPFVDTSDEHCQGGTDPAIGAFGVFVAVCFFPVLVVGPANPGDPPSVGIDLSPCSSSGIDPAITVGDGGFYFCVEAMVDP